MTQDLVVNSGRNLIIEQMLIYFLQAVQIDDILRIQARIIHHTRRSAIIDYDILSQSSDCVKSKCNCKN